MNSASPAPNQDALQKKPWHKRIKWDWTLLAVLAPLTLVLSLVFQDQGRRAGKVTWEFFLEMLVIFPAVLIIMGLFAVWVSREKVVKYLGEGSGIRGLVLSMLLGALPTGPLYIAFPMGAMLLKKGARVANVMAFLSAWACIKIPQELMEFQFMGWKFALTRLSITIVLVGILCLIAEWIYNRIPEKADKSKSAGQT
ncbi:MAG: permease [Actinobacteria bacterium]|nr:permease [Actinomycetota bacterium]